MEDIGKSLQPSLFDGIFVLSGAIQDVTDAIIKETPTKPARLAKVTEDPYNAELQGYSGEDGMKYEIPLSKVTPSEFHCRKKFYNIHIVLDNISDIANNELLPQTAREKKLWSNYPMMKVQLFVMPFCCCFPVVYMTCRQLQARLRFLKGRAYPLMLSMCFAEQWYERTYPSYTLLNEALTARSALGDAARADWQRLQPLNITYRQRVWYLFSRLTGASVTGYEFGSVV
ncbi:hypothetical protein XU18_0090 [Perkinsela sp. CCAP 1560/4]|nr:hypothetical protein XU18_0090 [Perkinsela sp. CCAP 1560/4]|eukprot:KNH09405.1 hypothetical protein XU18_0090 [Perkinsela sp. CCAP 1560/4]